MEILQTLQIPKIEANCRITTPMKVGKKVEETQSGGT
jgi:hypothetical protein